MTKSLREYIRELRRLGYEVLGVDTSRHHHIRARTPMGSEVVFSVGMTPSDVRAIRNFSSEARRVKKSYLLSSRSGPTVSKV